MIDVRNAVIGAGLIGAALSALIATTAMAEERDPDAFAKSGKALSYYSTPNRRHTEIKGNGPVTLGSVDVDVKVPSDALIQFTSGLATVTPEGCPCSVRAMLKVDDQEPIVIKRVNLGTAVTNVDGKYMPDRQPTDGSFAMPMAAGKHRVSLIVLRVDGTAPVLHAFYPNLQVLLFPAK